MRITLVTAAAPSPNLPSQALYNVAQAGALAYIGHETDILTFRPGFYGVEKLHPKLRRIADRPALYTHEGVTIRSVPAPWLKSEWMRFQGAKTASWAYPMWTRLALGRVLRRELRGVDAVVVHGTYPLGITVADCVNDDVRVIVVEHSLPEVSRLANSPKIARWYHRTARRASKIFGVSPIAVNHLKDCGIHNAQLLLNGPGTTPPGLHEDESPRTPRLSRKPGGQRTLLTLGQFIERKGLTVLLNALGRIVESHDVRLMHIGGGGTPPEQITRLVHDLGLEDRVDFLGHQPNQRVLELMSDADLFVLPSWDESFGIVYAEALSVGTPVVLTHSCGFAQFMTDGIHGRIVEPRSIDSLASALDDLLTRDDLDKVGREGIQLIRENFSWEENARQIEKALLE